MFVAGCGARSLQQLRPLCSSFRLNDVDRALATSRRSGSHPCGRRRMGIVARSPRTGSLPRAWNSPPTSTSTGTISRPPIERKLDSIMADLSALNAAVMALSDAEHAAAAELSKLADEVASLTAGAVTQDQIDSIAASVTNVASQLQADVAGAESAPPAPPA